MYNPQKKRHNNFKKIVSRKIWIINWQTILNFWILSPGFIFIEPIRNCVPIYYQKQLYNGYKLKNTTLKARKASKENPIINITNDVSSFKTGRPPKKVKFNDGIKSWTDSQSILIQDRILFDKDLENSIQRNYFYICQYLNLKNNSFFNGPYVWKYGLQNAYKVLEYALDHHTVFDLLLKSPFTEQLNLHKSLESLSLHFDNSYDEMSMGDIVYSEFYRSNKSQQEYFDDLEISKWNYDTIIISAVCFILGHLFREYCIEDLSVERLNENLTSFFTKIICYFYFPISEKLLILLKEIKFFSYCPKPVIANYRYLIGNIYTERYYSKNFFLYKKTLINYLKLFDFDFILTENLVQSLLDEPFDFGIKQYQYKEKTFTPFVDLFAQFLYLCDISYKNMYPKKPVSTNLIDMEKPLLHNSKEYFTLSPKQLGTEFHYIIFVTIFFAYLVYEINENKDEIIENFNNSKIDKSKTTKFYIIALEMVWCSEELPWILPAVFILNIFLINTLGLARFFR